LLKFRAIGLIVDLLKVPGYSQTLQTLKSLILYLPNYLQYVIASRIKWSNHKDFAITSLRSQSLKRVDIILMNSEKKVRLQEAARLGDRISH